MTERHESNDDGDPVATRRAADDRIAVEALVTLSPEGGAVEAVACEVSETGLRIETDNPPAPGPITFKMVGMPIFWGEVRWQQARHIGVRFARPLTPEHLETWVKAHGAGRGSKS
jgi:hypothetical protein